MIEHTIDVKKLKPCPFCGGPAQLVNRENPYHGTESVVIQCVNCGAEGPCCNSTKETEEAWNKRAEPKWYTVFTMNAKPPY